MKKIITKLQSRPEEERKKLAVILAAISTAIVVVIWIILRITVLGQRDSITIQNPVDFEQLDVVFEEAASQIGEGREDLRANNVFDEESFGIAVEAENSLGDENLETTTSNENQFDQESNFEISQETQEQN